MLLGITTSTTKNVSHLGLVCWKVVYISVQLVLYLELLAFKSRVFAVRKDWWVRDL